MTKVSFYIFMLSILTLGSCKTIFKTSPYQTYLQSLKTAGLDGTDMGKQWIDVGERVLLNPNQQLKFPFKEEIFFRQDKPAAVAYQIDYKKSSEIKSELLHRVKKVFFWTFLKIWMTVKGF